MAAIVHPHAQPKHHDAGKQCRAAFKQFALGAADVNHIRRQRPGTEPGKQGQAPAHVDAAHRRLLAGIAQEGEDRRQHQDCFQAFAQQDQQA
ncbi:hypothetical protein D3C79_937350 [compost metagenome]